MPPIAWAAGTPVLARAWRVRPLGPRGRGRLAVMGSTAGFATYIVEQLRDVREVSTRRMFGEFALYVGVKVVGFICDDQLFLKPTPEGLAVLADNDLDPEYAPAYPGSKDYLLIDIDSSEILCDLVRATADALPVPPPKKPRKQRRAKDDAEK